MRKPRLETVLGSWRMPSLAHWAESATPPDGTALTPQEWLLWLEILRIAEPVPPRNHIDGLRIYARLHDLNLEELIRDKAILVIDDQVAVRGHVRALGLRGHEWSLLVPEQLAGQATDAVLQKRFREVEPHGDTVLVTGSWQNCTDSVAVLVCDALTATTPSALGRLWKLSLALSLDYRFLLALPPAPAKALADLLRDELLAAAGKLTVETDARLALSAAGGDEALAAAAIPSLRMPASRLGDLLEAERLFDGYRHGLAIPYYDTLAAAYARIADVFDLGNLLLKLDPGSAVLAALEVVWRDRPEFIASYVWHPELHAEGAFALLQLPQQIGLSMARRLDMTEEWLEAQRIGRELLLFGNPPKDWANVVTLGVHDESVAIGRRHYGVAPSLLQKVPYDGSELWIGAVSDPERSQHYIDVLDGYFHVRTARSDPAIVFALRLHAALRHSGQRALATRLATAIVDGYAAGLALDIEVSAIPGVLCAYGELLAALRESLDVTGETWRKLLRPFDRVAYADAARADDTGSAGSTKIHPAFHVPRIFRAHAETLVALASSIEPFDEPLQAALELYETDRRAELNVEAFSWTSLARITGLQGTPVCEALFMRIGHLLGRDPGGGQRLHAFLSSEHPAHILAYVAAGLGGAHPLAKVIQPKLRPLINALLADPHGIALGHALELANVLQQAGMPRDSERLARRALEVIDRFGPHGREPYRPVARALLAGALAQQQLWPEVLALPRETEAMVLSPHARFVENMRALALIASDRLDEAAEVLRRVLEVDAANSVALVNLTALHLRARDWRKTIEAAERAKVLLSADNRDHVLLNEAHAREQMGDTFGAASLLDALTGQAKTRADVVEAREQLRRGNPTVPQPAPDVASAGDDGQEAPTEARDVTPTTRALPAKPADAVDVAIVTALKEEYEAVRKRLTDCHEVTSDAGQYTNLYGWITGTIHKADGSGDYRVVLAWAGHSGNLRTLITTKSTIDRWHPRYVLFSGIAGGLKKDTLRQGDVVVSQTIWYYEYGKVSDGKLKPRHRDSFRVDVGLLSAASAFDSATSDWKQCGLPSPSSGPEPKLVVGMIGSGEKVIDDLGPDFVRAILDARPELQAIEMEAAGACVAIEAALSEGKQVGFLMVRGISDMPAAQRGGLDFKAFWGTLAAASARFVGKARRRPRFPPLERCPETRGSSTRRRYRPSS